MGSPDDSILPPGSGKAVSGDALKEGGFAFEYERKRGDDVIEVWVNADKKMAVRIEWLRIDEEGWRV